MPRMPRPTAAANSPRADGAARGVADNGGRPHRSRHSHWYVERFGAWPQTGPTSPVRPVCRRWSRGTRGSSTPAAGRRHATASTPWGMTSMARRRRPELIAAAVADHPEPALACCRPQRTRPAALGGTDLRRHPRRLQCHGLLPTPTQAGSCAACAPDARRVRRHRLPHRPRPRRRGLDAAVDAAGLRIRHQFATWDLHDPGATTPTSSSRSCAGREGVLLAPCLGPRPGQPRGRQRVPGRPFGPWPGSRRPRPAPASPPPSSRMPSPPASPPAGHAFGVLGFPPDPRHLVTTAPLPLAAMPRPWPSRRSPRSGWVRHGRHGARLLLVPAPRRARPRSPWAGGSNRPLTGLVAWGVAVGFGVRRSGARRQLVDPARRASAYGVFAGIQGGFAIVGGLGIGWLYGARSPPSWLSSPSRRAAALVIPAGTLRTQRGDRHRGAAKAPRARRTSVLRG